MLWKETAGMNLFLAAKVPLVPLMRPRVEALDARRCTVRIPLHLLTKNHVGSMYIGVLTAGAELSVGVLAMELARKQAADVVPIFKDFHAEYLKRADGDVVFTCEDGQAIGEALAKARATGERVTLPVRSVATVPKKYGDEPVARFTLGLSIKRKRS